MMRVRGKGDENIIILFVLLIYSQAVMFCVVIDHLVKIIVSIRSCTGVPRAGRAVEALRALHLL